MRFEKKYKTLSGMVRKKPMMTSPKTKFELDHFHWLLIESSPFPRISSDNSFLAENIVRARRSHRLFLWLDQNYNV